jgi:glycosyltransferase involved in cell wall biosynthesis
MMTETKKQSQNQCAPKVSVIIPAYEIASCIAETLDSVFAQTFTDFEVIIVNDGSPDTAEFEREILPFLDKIVYLKQKNGGASSARNAAIRSARGEILAFLDGDDVWLPEYLASQIAFLEASNFDMVYADAAFFGENVPPNQTYMQFSISNGAVTTESLLSWECSVITSGTIIYKEKFLAAGFFDESEVWRRAQDFEMWFRLLKHGARIGYQREVLLKYRLRRGSLTGNSIVQAERNIDSLNGILAKFELTPGENRALNNQLQVAKAILQIETGKAALLGGDYEKARENFSAANRFYRKPKLAVINLLLKFAPATLRRIFQKRLEIAPPHSHADVL